MEKLKRPFSLLPVQVVPNEYWETDYDVSTIDLWGIIYTEFRDGDTPISFAEAYRKRWMEQAVQDSEGKWWLKNSRSITIPLWKWAQDRGFYIYFLQSEITFTKPTKLPSP